MITVGCRSHKQFPLDELIARAGLWQLAVILHRQRRNFDSSHARQANRGAPTASSRAFTPCLQFRASASAFLKLVLALRVKQLVRPVVILLRNQHLGRTTQIAVVALIWVNKL